MKTATHRSLKKVSELVDAAQALFFRHGVRRVTIEEICRVSGVSKVTFYKYFKNKKALAAHIKSELLHQGFSKLDETIARDLPYPEKAGKMIQWRIRFFAGMGRDFIDEMFSDDNFQQMFRHRFLNCITAAQNAGEIRPDLSPELIWLAMEKLDEIAADGSWRDIFIKYGEYQEQIRTIFHSGVLTRMQ